MRLLRVREAARALDVHENTLRRWETAGLIRAVKLPTGVRRFRPEDIARLRAEMYEELARDALEADEKAFESETASAPAPAPAPRAAAAPAKARKTRARGRVA